MKDNIILCGLPGTGKTETGKRLALMMGWEYIDTDSLLETYYKELTGLKVTCRELFREVGDNKFRELENQMLSSLGRIEKRVISVGGGTLNKGDNIKLLKELGHLVFLKNERTVIFDRLMNKGMPSYLDPENPFESFQKLADFREKIYESAADTIFNTGLMTPDEIAAKILEKLKRG